MGKKKLRVGIIGCGRFSEPGHALHYKLNPRCEFAAVCDTREEQARKLAKLQLKLIRLNRELDEKAAKTQTIGKLLYNKDLLDTLEAKLKLKQGDRYDPSHVADAALINI